jgi:hypothetical protein
MIKVIRATALTLLLACTAQAGIMGNETPAPAPAPTPTPATAEEVLTPTATVEDGTQGTYQTSLTQMALELLAIWPSLL